MLLNPALKDDSNEGRTASEAETVAEIHPVERNSQDAKISFRLCIHFGFSANGKRCQCTNMCVRERQQWVCRSHPLQ